MAKYTLKKQSKVTWPRKTSFHSKLFYLLKNSCVRKSEGENGKARKLHKYILLHAEENFRVGEKFFFLTKGTERILYQI